MKIQQLEYVIAVAREGSITKAAKKLYQAQPNISIALKELEASLGIQIFNRSPNGMILTPEGEEFLARAQTIVDEMQSLERDYAQTPDNEMKLKVAAARSTYATAAIGKFISSYADKTDKIDVHVMETSTAKVLEDICAGKYDIGFIRIPSTYAEMIESRLKARNLVGRTIMEFPLQIVMSEKHPLAKYDDVPYELLSEYPEIIHGDDESEMVRRASINPDYDEKRSTKRILIYDRGTQISMLKTVKDAYMWVAPMSQLILKFNELCTRKSSYATNLNRDMIIYRKASENNALISDCIRTVFEYADKIEGLEI
ncbi:LysR family transcriptional regulator [Ruminococcus flavefaciens]|jgi:DNA-binding transcriptional LysR family regulator|uniref:LysR family transcriptional regulator n=1 Tax=Ruminococcus flavefaciens TaxID=1265 RepID=UPI0026EACFDB|nr:LysR family transcriptional regulator [Ruminococcus flavefaciens]